ncbi:GEgh16 protein [Colletotrichum graminicola]|uniref:GEgh16 protein n=1 Tax=Colletotrichum graminicola (strain M1.001 / M2 / FGSC 10212) TaxID=645133 RepID=E3Q5S4_COLGM|nr:GEgh16 protein [Colletotrichum graminicola M1.001]EFQ26172.1 GEgh16 protein [Colletotrichum graminicola M1.001]WDK13947.1 GEgh16 protein [Colletotrichum graminicola]
MSSPMRALIASAMLAMANAQGVIIKAQGPSGPAGAGLLVDPTKADANIINLQEITQNVVNECGRTILAGNIDIGETTENQLGNNTVTHVTKGSNVDITIAQVSADGAGPYTCDLDPTSNSIGATGQTKLAVKEAKAQNGNIKLTVTMPKDLACVGASTGNVCTVRCFNSNAKGPFGGCIAVQQTDVKPKKNTPGNIATAQTLDNVLTQVQQNTIDLPAAIQANQDAPTQNDQGVTAVKEILGNNATLKAAGPAEGGNGNGNGNANKGNGKGGNRGNAGGKNKGAGNAQAGGNAQAQQNNNGKGKGSDNDNDNKGKGGNDNDGDNRKNKRELRDTFRSRRARRNAVPAV